MRRRSRLTWKGQRHPFKQPRTWPRGGYYDFVASRAYYAAFYAATAVLLCEDLEFGKHSGVIAFIHREFVKTGRLDERHGKNLNWLFELRGVGDYGATVHVSRRDAERAINVADEFVDAIKVLIDEVGW